jgi:ubiquinone/menaquinone biosynthesis C-methylase UbiE
MSLYSHRIFPCLCEWGMSRRPLMECRREVLSGARGRVLEIGVGTGLNLPLYPQHVKRITAIDANAGMMPRAQKRAARTAIEIDLRIASAEELPLESGQFDTVVSTWTLCSIPDVAAALREVRRVLKPDGIFLFVEHGLSDDAGIRWWQNRLTPLNRRLADGCHLNRDMESLIGRNGFAFAELRKYYLKKIPRIAGFLYQGKAILSQRGPP